MPQSSSFEIKGGGLLTERMANITRTIAERGGQKPARPVFKPSMAEGELPAPGAALRPRRHWRGLTRPSWALVAILAVVAMGLGAAIAAGIAEGVATRNAYGAPTAEGWKVVEFHADARNRDLAAACTDERGHGLLLTYGKKRQLMLLAQSDWSARKITPLAEAEGVNDAELVRRAFEARCAAGYAEGS